MWDVNSSGSSDLYGDTSSDGMNLCDEIDISESDSLCSGTDDTDETDDTKGKKGNLKPPPSFFELFFFECGYIRWCISH